MTTDSTSRPTSPPRILIVDDEPLLREGIARDFRKLGYDVLLAADGREAYELFSRREVDVVLSDIRMPGGDGIELLNRIRTGHPDAPPVILMSGYSEVAASDVGAMGAYAILPKPFDRALLRETVEKSVRTRRSSASAR